MKKGLYFLLSIILLMQFGVGLTLSVNAARDVRVLLVTDVDVATDRMQGKILDSIISPFADVYDVYTTEQFEDVPNVNAYDVLVYFGEVEKALSQRFVFRVDRFEGKVLWLGRNGEQTERISSLITYGPDEIVSDIMLYNESVSLGGATLVRSFETEEGLTTYLEAIKGEQRFPLLVGDERTFIFNAMTLFDPIGQALASALPTIFQKTVGYETMKYIRLEDIHPHVDISQLKAVTDLLHEKEIPYMVTVIPKYYDEVTDSYINLADVPELVDLLLDMQSNGASIVLHGYTHQYRQSETGEGFEFWDVELDRPVYQPSDVYPSLNMDWLSGRQYEESYIRSRVETGIAELVALGLFPIAFEAPHYTFPPDRMPLLREYFSTYVGQLQLSNKTWKPMYSAPYIASPHYTNRMTVIPETLGYVENEASIDEMVKRANALVNQQGAMLGAFYHPYLGEEPFKRLLRGLESIEGAEWFDLRTVDAEVKTKDVHIVVEDGEVKLDHRRTKQILL
ncbi:MAG: DUF2334 domain-containing protein, partial [Bacilli bacterium]